MPVFAEDLLLFFVYEMFGDCFSTMISFVVVVLAS